MMADIFTCACCGETFEKKWSEADALAEFNALYPGVDPKDTVVVCDECHGELLAWRARRQ